MSSSVEFVVFGEPKPAGSKRAFPFRKADGGLGVRVAHDNPKTRSWMQDVAACARAAMKDRKPFESAVSLKILFERPRPKSHYCKRGLLAHGALLPYPTMRPDTVKLARAIEDALTHVAWRDDSQVVHHDLRKMWGKNEYRTFIMVLGLFED